MVVEVMVVEVMAAELGLGLDGRWSLNARWRSAVGGCLLSYLKVIADQ